MIIKTFEDILRLEHVNVGYDLYMKMSDFNVYGIPSYDGMCAEIDGRLERVVWQFPISIIGRFTGERIGVMRYYTDHPLKHVCLTVSIHGKVITKTLHKWLKSRYKDVRAIIRRCL